MRPWIVVQLAAALMIGAGAGPSVADARTRVAILPVVIHSLDGDQYLREGLADMMASRLGRSPGIAVVRVDEAAQATTDLDQARAAGRGVGADYVLFGSFTHFGQGASLDLSCAAVGGDTEGAPRRIFIHSGTIGEIIPRLDDVMEKVSRFVQSPDQPEPGVAAAPPGTSGATDASLLDALSELEALRERVQALEQRVYEGSPSAVSQTEVGEQAGADEGFDPMAPPDSGVDSVR